METRSRMSRSLHTNRDFEKLEPYEGKPSRTVLRGEEGSNALDLPDKVKFRSGPYLLSPQTTYECMGDVPNVCFPCAALHDPETGRIAVYYGCADTVTGLAFGYIPEIVEFTKRTSII